MHKSMENWHIADAIQMKIRGDSSIQSGPTKSMHRALRLFVKLEAKMLGHVDFGFEGDTF